MEVMEIIEDESFPYIAETKNFLVMVKPVWLEDHSLPDENKYVWAYYVRIENQSDNTAQLISRYWKITDSLGRTHEVKGTGVVGEQPVLKPGDSFEYSSGTPLDCPDGIMGGVYSMKTENGESFEIDIPTFSLDSPYSQQSIN